MPSKKYIFVFDDVTREKMAKVSTHIIAKDSINYENYEEKSHYPDFQLIVDKFNNDIIFHSKKLCDPLSNPWF